MKKIRAIELTFSTLLIAASALSAAAQNTPFTAIDIGVVTDLGGLSNDVPVKAVGQDSRTGRLRAFVFSEGQATPRALEFVPGDSPNATSRATALSDDGAEAVGVDQSQPTDWPNPVGPSNPGHFPTPLPCAGFGTPVALNDSRVAVGVCPGGEGLMGRPLRWAANGALTAAALPAGPFGGRANDVNNAGIIVGQTTNNEGTKLAAIWTSPDQQPLAIGLIDARGISSGSVLPNNADLITMLGMSPDPAGIPRQRGWTWMFANGALALISIGRLPFFPMALPPSLPPYYQYVYQTFTAAETRDINRSGLTVGFAKKSNGETRAAAWNLSGQVALLDTNNVSGLPAGAILTDAVDVNDQGYVLVKGTVNGVLHGFMLRPTGNPIGFLNGY